MSRKAWAGVIVVYSLLASCDAERPVTATRLTGAVVEYGRVPSGFALRGVLYQPDGAGPFPTLLYAHGSAPGLRSNEAFEAVAQSFRARGWALFAPYRRGQGLSIDAGPYIRDEIAAARAAGGHIRAQARLVELLATDQMDDQVAAYSWLSRQPSVDRQRIAVMGNSFGGIIALLSAERLPVCGAVDAAGAAESWDGSPTLQTLMIRAATKSRAPIFLMQARNDHSVAPSRIVHAAMVRAGKPSELRLYPPFGQDARDGHAFSYKGVGIWANDVHAFLKRACTVRPPVVSGRSAARRP